MTSDSNPNRLQKKTERLDVRISHEKKQAFSKACENQGDTPSHAVRRFINSYIRRDTRDEAGAAVRTFFKPKRRQAIVGLFVLGVLVFGGLYFHNQGPSNSELFAIYDADKNGTIDLGEMAANDFHLHRVLNIDGEAGISPDEFITKATMVWSFVDPDKEIVVSDKKTAFSHKRVTTSTSDVPEDSFVIPADPDADPIPYDEFIAGGMKADLREPTSEEFRTYNRSKPQSKKESKFNNKFVIFNLRHPAKMQINVLEQNSQLAYSESMIYSRSVDWEEGKLAPHFVMGTGSEKAVLSHNG